MEIWIVNIVLLQKYIIRFLCVLVLLHSSFKNFVTYHHILLFHTPFPTAELTILNDTALPLLLLSNSSLKVPLPLSRWLLNGSFLVLGTLRRNMLLPFPGRCSYAKVHAGVSSWNPVILKMETARSSETSTCYTQCQDLLRTLVVRTSTKFLPLTAATHRVVTIQIIQRVPRPQ
jgi:hypothetical protein